MKMHDGITRTLQQVRYVPELKRNLLSIDMFASNGFAVKIDKNIDFKDIIKCSKGKT